MNNYFAKYTRISKNYRDLEEETEETSFFKIEKGENLEEKVNKIFEDIVNNPEANNTAIQIHGVYEITKEVKLKNYNFKKK